MFYRGRCPISTIWILNLPLVYNQLEPSIEGETRYSWIYYFGAKYFKYHLNKKLLYWPCIMVELPLVQRLFVTFIYIYYKPLQVLGFKYERFKLGRVIGQPLFMNHQYYLEIINYSSLYGCLSHLLYIPIFHTIL